ncbi:MAG TPA: hypothetical protein GXX75_00230 [Clostridiales bacterium]|nr:hypothetical protein [Clostridiales bacterium]
MKKKKTVNFRNITALMLILLLLIGTACAEKQNEPKTSVDEIPSEQGAQNISSIPDTIQLNFTARDFSNIPLSLLNDSQIGSIVNSTKIDDMVTYVEYIPKEFNEENPEGYTYSYIEVSGIRYALSRSLGGTWYDLTKATLAETDTVYTINEVRGANYGVTIFFMIKEKTPYIISEIDGFAQISDIDENGTKEVVSTVGTVPDTSIYFFDFDEQTVSIANINGQSGAEYSMYDATTNTFSLAFEPNQNPVAYVYETNERLRADMNQNNIENSDEPFWAQPMEEHGQLFTGLNLDGIGDYDDEAYVSLYDWDDNGFGRYDASELVVRIRFGTGDTTAHIVQAVGSYQFYTAKLFSEKKDAIVLEVNIQYANSGLVSVFALDVYGPGEVDPFPSVVERLNTTGEAPILSADGEKLYTGSLVIGTNITDVENKPLQGIVLHSTGDGYRGNIGDRESQTIYWNGDGWVVLERLETKQN